MFVLSFASSSPFHFLSSLPKGKGRERKMEEKKIHKGWLTAGDSRWMKEENINRE